MRALIMLFCFLSLQAIAQVSSISGGHKHSIAVCKQGSVYTWGSNKSGQMGNPDFTHEFYSYPMQIELADIIIQVEGGTGDHNLALSVSQELYAWGSNKNGQTGTNRSDSIIYSPEKVKGGETQTEYLSDIVDISGGNLFSYAVLSSGEVVSWGDNSLGCLGNHSTENSLVPVYVLRKDSSHLLNIKRVEAGDKSGYALTKDGYVYSWGYNENGALGRKGWLSKYADLVTLSDGTALKDIIEISAGDNHCLALDKFGQVWSWGGNWGQGQLGNGTNYPSESFPKKVVGGETGTEFLENAIDIAAGQAHSLVVLADGHMVSFGSNLFHCGVSCAKKTGQLGLGMTADGSNAQPYEDRTLEPKYALTSSGRRISGIYRCSEGDAVSFALDTNDNVYVAGYNQEGGLGIGHTSNQEYFTQLYYLENQCPLLPPCPSVLPGQDITTCQGDIRTIYTHSIYSHYTYKWYKNGEQLQPTLSTLSISDTGIYSVEVSNPYNTHCLPVKYDIQVRPSPNPFTVNENEFCNEPVKFEVSGDGKYYWYYSETDNAPADSGTAITVNYEDLQHIQDDSIVFMYAEDVKNYHSTIRQKITGYTNESFSNFPNLATLTFTTGKDIFLDTITVVHKREPDTRIVIDIKNRAGELLGTSSVTFPSGYNSKDSVDIPVNIFLPKDSGYIMTAERSTIGAVLLYYNFENSTVKTYPEVYDAGDEFSIVRLDSGRYYQYFESSTPALINWKIRYKKNHPCGKVPVASINKCVLITDTKTSIRNQATSLEIYPVPVQTGHFIYISSPTTILEPEDILIVDISGKEVSNLQPHVKNGSLYFNSSFLNRGIYFVINKKAPQQAGQKIIIY